MKNYDKTPLKKTPFNPLESKEVSSVAKSPETTPDLDAQIRKLKGVDIGYLEK